MSKELSRQIDALIVSCALGMACDEAELMRLATEYRRKYKSPYELNDMHMRSLETDAEKSIALNLEAKINDIDVNYTMMQFYNELGSKGDIFKNRKSIKRVASKVSPKGTPKTSPKTSPKGTPRASSNPCSPKTRRGYCNVQGGKRKTNRRRN